MGTRRTDKYRTAELVVHVGATQHVAALFAVEHVRGVQSRRLLARHISVGPGPVNDSDALLDLLQTALDNLRAGNATLPR